MCPQGWTVALGTGEDRCLVLIGTTRKSPGKRVSVRSCLDQVACEHAREEMS